MTLQKVCEQYRLDGELIAALAKKGVFCADGFCDGDVCRAAVACFLHECGLGTEDVAAYFLTRDGEERSARFCGACAPMRLNARMRNSAASINLTAFCGRSTRPAVR